MIKQMPVNYDEIAYYVEQIGEKNIISILPLCLKYSEQGITTHRGASTESTGDVVIDKYLLVYRY